MDGMEAVLDVGADSSGEQEIEEVAGQENGSEVQHQQGTETQDDPYSAKASKEYTNWLKGIRDSAPENAKFARVAKDDHARLFQLYQLEPKGIEGVREKYAILDGLVHGEFTGVEALSAMQDEVANFAHIDSLLSAGDPKVLDELGEGFAEGLAKLAPSILDRIQQNDPEAYSRAVLPHFVSALASSPLVSNYNAMVDVMQEKMPNWLPADKQQAWIDDKMNRIIGLAAQMGNWLNAQQTAAAKLKEGIPQGQPGKAGASRTSSSGQPTEQQKWETERNNAHWTEKINPSLDKHATDRFRELFRPYEKRLRLDAPALSSLRKSFTEGVVGKATANKTYMDQIKRYRAQGRPDPNTVINFAKVEFDKHAKSVMDSLINERYGRFLKGAARTAGSTTQQGSQTSAGNRGPVSPSVSIVSVKPASGDIDWKATKPHMIHQKQYVLKNGKTVQVR